MEMECVPSLSKPSMWMMGLNVHLVLSLLSCTMAVLVSLQFASPSRFTPWVLPPVIFVCFHYDKCEYNEVNKRSGLSCEVEIQFIACLGQYNTRFGTVRLCDHVLTSVFDQLCDDTHGRLEQGNILDGAGLNIHWIHLILVSICICFRWVQ